VSTNAWRGDAPAVARVVTLTVGGTVGSGDTVSYAIGTCTVAAAATGSDTKATLAAALYAALAASDDARMKDVSWGYVDGDEFVTGTASTPGVPFAGTAAGTGTTTLTEAETTASSGPSHADEPLNWSAGTLPAAGEDVLVAGGADLLYGLENITRAAYNSFAVKASFTGNVGLARYAEAGYLEYRTRSFPLDTGVPVAVGEGDGQGPARVNLDIDTAASVVVHKTAGRQSDAVPVVNLVGASSGTVTVASGDVALAGDDDATACAVTTLTLDNDAAVTVGPGATASTANLDADGKLVAHGAVTTLNATGGTATLYQMPTTVTADGTCAVDLRGTGTATTVTARGQGEGKSPTVECGNNPRAKTFTNSSFTGAAVLNDPDKSVTFTNAATFDRESLRLSDLGSRFTLQRT
jgi:hypothetical protein